MIRIKLGYLCLLAPAAVCLSAQAAGHGLLVTATEDRGAIVRRVYYSDGTAGAGEFVELRDLGAPRSQPQSATTDNSGAFRFPALIGHRYALLAYGEEGHMTEVRLTLSTGARGRMVDNPEPGAKTAEEGLLPAWMMIGALLGISALLAAGRQALKRRASRLIRRHP